MLLYVIYTVYIIYCILNIYIYCKLILCDAKASKFCIFLQENKETGMERVIDSVALFK